MDDALHYYGMPYLYLYALFGHLKKLLSGIRGTTFVWVFGYTE